MSDTTIQAFQGIAVAGLSILGSWLVARLSKRARSEQTDVDAQSRATDAWESYSARLEKRLDDLEHRFQAAERQQDEDRRRIRRLERERENDRDLIRRLVYRLRWALGEIRRLGGDVPPSYDTLADDASHRIEFDRS